MGCNSIVFNDDCNASVITVLALTLGANEPLRLGLNSLTSRNPSNHLEVRHVPAEGAAGEEEKKVNTVEPTTAARTIYKDRHFTSKHTRLGGGGLSGFWGGVEGVS